MKNSDARRSYHYRVVDVFTQHPLEGNALAVFTNASGLSDETMQRIAREMNLAETTFVFPATRPDCAAALRIFTPSKELAFAGHPTIGTAFVLLENGVVRRGAGRFSLEEKVGPVAIRVEAGEPSRIWLRTPPIEYGTTYERSACAGALGLRADDLLDVTPQLVSAGNPTVFVGVKDERAVDRAWLDSRGMQVLKGSGGADRDSFCVFVFAPTATGAYSRLFAPDYGIPEDPATGSSTGPLASFMMRHGLASSAAGTRFVSEQGTTMGRRSLLYVEVFGEHGADGIDVGGYVSPVAACVMTL